MILFLKVQPPLNGHCNSNIETRNELTNRTQWGAIAVDHAEGLLPGSKRSPPSTNVAALLLRRTGFLIGYLGTFRSIGLAVVLPLGLGCTLLGLVLLGLGQQMIPTWVSWLGALLFQPSHTASFALINSPIHLGEY